MFASLDVKPAPKWKWQGVNHEVILDPVLNMNCIVSCTNTKTLLTYNSAQLRTISLQRMADESFFFFNVGPFKEDIFSGHLLSPVIMTNKRVEKLE